MRTSTILLLLLLFNSCQRKVIPVYFQGSPFAVKQQEGNTPAIDTLFAPYRAQLDSAMQITVGLLGEKMEKKGKNGSLGFFIADALLHIAQQQTPERIDGCVINAGGIRLPELPAGIIKTGKVYELLPFDNELVVLSMSGKELLVFFQHVLRSGGWPVSNISIDYSDSLLVNIRVGEKQLEENNQYRLLMHDYIANGGDRCSMLSTLPRSSLQLLLRDALIRYLKKSDAAQAAVLQEPKQRWHSK